MSNFKRLMVLLQGSEYPRPSIGGDNAVFWADVAEAIEKRDLDIDGYDKKVVELLDERHNQDQIIANLQNDLRHLEQEREDLREAKEKLHLFKYAVDAAKDGGAFTADGWTMISSKLHSDLLVAKEQVKGAEELLREVEWAYIEGVGNECPHCKRDRDVPSLIDGRVGHAPDCKLKAWLERTLRGSGGGEG